MTKQVLAAERSLWQATVCDLLVAQKTSPQPRQKNEEWNTHCLYGFQGN